jgi:PAS domain S-box-containing protein
MRWSAFPAMRDRATDPPVSRSHIRFWVLPFMAANAEASLFEGVLENAPVALQVRAADGRVVLTNQRFRELFGADFATDADDVGELVRRSLQGETVRVPPRWYRSVEGAGRASERQGPVWGALTLFPLPTCDGSVECVTLCLQDMTEQAVREESLVARAKENEVRAAMVDAALDCVVTMDASGRVTHFNAAAAETFGYEPSYAVGRTLAELIVPPRFQAAHEAGLARYLATSEGPILRRRIELTAMRAGGAEFPVELIVVPFQSDGAPVFTGFVRDLTARKEVEKALLRSEARFRTLTEAGFLGIITANLDGAIVEANECFLRIVGYTLEDVREGRVRWSEITAPEWRHLDDRAIEQLRETGVAAPWEKEYVRKDGRRVPVLVGVAMLDAAKGESVAFILDISDRKEAERTVERMRKEREAGLEESIRARDDFLAIAGHELKTPLAALLMQLQSLQRTAGTRLPARVGERLDKVAAAGTRLRRLVDQLLDVSRLTAGGLRLEPEQVDLSELVEEIVTRVTETSTRPMGSVIVRSEPHVIGLWDHERMEQAIENLVENAIKYGQGKPVEIDLGTVGPEVVLRVTDHGVGIDEDQQKRIFDRFERAVSTRDFGGLGLGLWIARRVVEASGGRIAVRSAPGEGATFTVRLPNPRGGHDGTEASDAQP